MDLLTRDDLATRYLEQLPFVPYPAQEEALLAWFTGNQGVLVCAPTGTGKTLIAQAALFEALHTGTVAYYTTPLIALTDQKFQEMQSAAVRWGFSANDIGLVTGNRKVNPEARVLVVVAEILLNRLLHTAAFDFSHVSAVVMDEFHSFNDPERGIVWELSLSLLPKHVRLLLLSATVGNTAEFLLWLNRAHGRNLELVQSTDRKVPLRYHWVGDELLNEQLEIMARGDEATRKTPVLVFCFNRDECWNVAEQLKGKDLLHEGQQKELARELDRYNWSQGIGPKLRTLLMRGVGVHHAGVLPKYKRIIEDLFQRKLLTVCVCTETLSAGMNLPARSVLLTTLLKGPAGKKTLIDPSVAHQIFGRAGRPQYDVEGHVFALAHEDDVRIQRFKERIDQIPEDTKDPLLIKKRKELKKKMPTRRKNEQYWTVEQFNRLVAAPPTHLKSQGPFPWRLLAYLLSITPEVSLLRQAVSKRLTDPKTTVRSLKTLTEMLLTLKAAGHVTLIPPPPPEADNVVGGEADRTPIAARLREMTEAGRFGPQPQWSGEYAAAVENEQATQEFSEDQDAFGTGVFEEHAVGTGESGETASSGTDKQPSRDLGSAPDNATSAQPPSPSAEIPEATAESSKPERLTSTLKFLLEAQGVRVENKPGAAKSQGPRLVRDDAVLESYEPQTAYPTESLAQLLTFKSINPLYGMFLLDVLPYADGPERVQALESVLEFPIAVVRALRIPRSEILPPSVFTREFLNPELLQRGLATPAELAAAPAPDQQDLPPEERVWPLTFPEKLVRLFHAESPGVHDLRITPVWAAGELLHFRGDFNKLVTSRKIAKQEGIVFRHVLRFILLCDEFLQHVVAGTSWHEELVDISAQLTDACRGVDPYSTDQMIESAKAADVIEGEDGAAVDASAKGA